MLIRRDVLDRIAAGEIDLLFRRQRRPTVREGGTLRTTAGVLNILDVEAVDEARIATAEAQRAGFATVAELRAELARKTDGIVFRVRVELGGDDPRIALRERSDISADEMAALIEQFAAFDRRSRSGPWTRATLEVIESHPHVRAPELASRLGRETAPFKTDVRKLKELGLTISHSPGYELSPRGRTVLTRLRDEESAT